MLISEIGIRGFKSFGNNEQILKLNTDRGELILLSGSNGAGKSSILDSFDYTLFGKVRGKKKKWTSLSQLPNRINGELLNRISFKSMGIDVEIKRGISPNKLEMWENGILNEQAGKSNIDEKIEKYVGMDVETFKSFISMSVNDFKNFISLSTEEKQLLLDKLFNMEVINILNNITKDLNKNNKIRSASLDAEIKTLEDSVNSIKESIDKAVAKERENIQQEVEELVNLINSKKEEYMLLKEKVDKIKDKEQILLRELDIEKKQYNSIENDIRNIQKEIDLYNKGKCPTCSTDFVSEHFINLKSLLVEKKATTNGLLNEVSDNIKSIISKQNKLKDIANTTNTTFNDVTYLMKGYKSRIDDLQRKQKSTSHDTIDISEFQKTIKELDDRKEIGVKNLMDCRDREFYYKELNKILGEDGVKKSIISSIIKPLNSFIDSNVRKMGLPFTVKLDETFTAEIKHFSSSIDTETLSTGEHKLTNICILTAYLMLIRTKKFINILFLDEVFSSVDLDNIQKILSLLKSFANEYKVNIIVVHHAVLNQEMFDRLISVEKNIFTEIKEVENI